MKHAHLIKILRATIDPNSDKRQQAEWKLDLMHSKNGFVIKLLQVVMDNDVSIPVRQAGAVCLKNIVIQSWYNQEGEVPKHIIDENERAWMRDVIVEAVVQAPDLIRIHLCLTLKFIMKFDLPSCWTQVVDKINMYLQNPVTRMAALQCIYYIIKNVEHTCKDKRVTLVDAMKLLLPVMYNIMIALQNDQSVESVLIKKQVLKCHHTLIKHTLALELYSKQVFTTWVEVFCFVLKEPVPEHTLTVDVQDRMELPWWKLKKWSIRALCRVFHGYACNRNPPNAFFGLSRWYLVTFTGGILEVLFQILDQFSNEIYVSPRVVHYTLDYIELCVLHSQSWKVLKPHMSSIIQKVVFPILTFSDTDQDLWGNPKQYLKSKYGLPDFESPIVAAKRLLKTACMKRKDVIESTMAFCMKVLTTSNYDPCHRDGAFHIIGIVHTSLTKRPNYLDEMSYIMEQLLFPEFDNPLGHMRVRALRVIQCFCDNQFGNDNLLFQAMELSIYALLYDSELAVKVEASFAIKWLLLTQEKAQGFLEPQVREVTSELLNILISSEVEDIASVIQVIVRMYTVQLQPMACEITEYLATNFRMNIAFHGCTDDEKEITAKSLLILLETVISAFEKSPQIIAKIEKRIFTRMVWLILQKHIVEYFGQVMFLLRKLSANNISEDMWNVLPMLYRVYQKEGFKYFHDMMPLLHNYITVDTNAFLANQNYLSTILSMIKAALAFASPIDVETELYAAKLLEVIVLECYNKDDRFVPSTVEMVLRRLETDVPDAGLRLMLLQVLVAMFYCNPLGLITILHNMRDTYPAYQNFIKDWLRASYGFTGIHSRRLSVLAICRLLDMGRSRPSVNEVTPNIIPCCIHLLEGLRRAYKQEEPVPSSSEYKEFEIEENLNSDEDGVDDIPNDYNMESEIMNEENSTTVTSTAVNNTAWNFVAEPFPSTPVTELDSDIDYSIKPIKDPEDRTDRITTPIERCQTDEFIGFQHSIQVLAKTDPNLYRSIMKIDRHQIKKLRAIFEFAEHRKKQLLSKNIDRLRGYKFKVPDQWPTTFKFGS